MSPGRAARYYQRGFGQLHRLACLIGGDEADPDDPDVRARARWAHLEDLALDADDVAGTDGARPAEVLDAGADGAPGGAQVALDGEAHHHRRRVPAAGREAAEEGVL